MADQRPFQQLYLDTSAAASSPPRSRDGDRDRDADQPGVERRRSRNPLRNMMQHLSVDPPSPSRDDEGATSPRRESLMRRLSRASHRTSRSPSVNSEPSKAAAAGSVPGTPTGRSSFWSGPAAAVVDPTLCRACASWAVDVDATFSEVDAIFAKAGGAQTTSGVEEFDRKEFTMMRLENLEEDRWTTSCPLCKLFWNIRVASEGIGDYYLAGFPSRDSNYLIDPAKLYESGHPAKTKDTAFNPAFLGVVPRKTGPGALGWDVDREWFRQSGMLFRTVPSPVSEKKVKTPVEEKSGWLDPSAAVAFTSSQRGIWGREMTEHADMNVAQEWLQHCKTHHQGRCGRKPPLAEIADFRLIDCAKNPPAIISASIREDYVALSYVWGDNTSKTWPATIRDAVTVTRDLGLQYLWVDKLCIDPSRLQDRIAHIYRMDEIYEGAVFTIIAAHGAHADHGLPGVGATARPPQPKYSFTNSGVTLVSSLRDPRLCVAESPWYTRGWTYQEGLLARRRLIFTEQQMYWECEGMACPESLVLPLGLYHDAAERRMCDFMRPGLLNGVSFVDGSWESWRPLQASGKGRGEEQQPSTLSIFREWDRHVVNYTRRELARDEDSLFAFLGLTRRLETTLGRGKLASVVGIPLWVPGNMSGVGGMPTSTRTRDMFALSTSFWHHRDGQDVRRRPHLPSWSWAGWKGAVDLSSSIATTAPPAPTPAATGNAPREKPKERKTHNKHYVSATQLTRNETGSLPWRYSPEMLLLRPDGQVAYDFGTGNMAAPGPYGWSAMFLQPIPYRLLVRNPLVLDRVKARVMPSGAWMFNDIGVDVKLSRPETAAGGVRAYIERHGRAEQMTVLWLIEETMVMLLVVERKERAGAWERVGRARMGFSQEPKEVLRQCGSLDVLLGRLPLRRLGEDLWID